MSHWVRKGFSCPRSQNVA